VTAENVTAILPEILILVLAGFVLLFDALWPDERRRSLGWLTAGGLALILAISVTVARPGDDPQSLFGGMIRNDWLGFVFQMVFLFVAAITCLFAMDVENLGTKGEFYLLLLVSTIGMNLMASAGDLVMLYLAIETTSIPLYVLAGFVVNDDKSTEAGFKYLLFGALTSTVMLYGFSLLYGFSGTTSLYDLANKIHLGLIPDGVLVGTLMLILVGFGFKISAVPFHYWAPDVYEGAPTPVTGFLSTASKAAGFAVLIRVLLAAFGGDEVMHSWTTLIAAMSVITMTLGNTLALAQKNIKRLLAYSSIAHAGYILIGLVAISPEGPLNLGIQSAVFYLIAYILTNLAVFGTVAAFERVSGSSEIDAYKGLSRRAPGLSLIMLVGLLSLAGMPPFGGFVAKVFVFAAAVETRTWTWLAVVGVLNAIIGLYYYLTVLKVVYLYRADNPEDEQKPLPISRPYTIAFVVLSAGIILIGTIFGPWFHWAGQAAQAIFASIG
jgi:NADH-quinone oxidoreductase subunit N